MVRWREGGQGPDVGVGYPSRVEDSGLLRGGKGGRSLALAYVSGHRYL